MSYARKYGLAGIAAVLRIRGAPFLADHGFDSVQVDGATHTDGREHASRQVRRT
jgi:hypothetical protein